MNTPTLIIEDPDIEHSFENDNPSLAIRPKHIINGPAARIINLRNARSFFLIAYQHFNSISKSFSALLSLRKLQKSVWGSNPQKWAYAGGRYHFMLYAPGFPSSQLNKMHLMEIRRMKMVKENSELRFAFFAITKKCPLRCQHCFEWDKLNAKELLSYDDLRNAIIKLKDMGIVQLHLSGGEPMLRVKDIARLANEFSNGMEFYVLTSGFNATRENLILLKQSGVTGIVVSLDHYDKKRHNAFRGSENSYVDAIHAILCARELDMVVTMTICVNREMATFNELLRYANLARSLDVSFIQLLEPRQVGNYAGKDVLLNKEQLDLLSNFYEKLNFTRQYNNYPIVIFHGYYQSKIGCFSAGNRALYIDTNGDVLLCPFCHHKTGNVVTDHIPSLLPKMRAVGCPSFGKAAF